LATPEDKIEALVLAFAESSELCELHDALDAFDDTPSDETERIEVLIPKRYVPLLDFIEAKSAIVENRPPLPVAEVLTNALRCQLEATRRQLAARKHPYYRQLWNRLCDEHGMPDAKESEPREPAVVVPIGGSPVIEANNVFSLNKKRLDAAIKSTPEIQELKALVDRIHASLNRYEDVGIHIDISPAFLELADFIDAHLVRRSGAPRPSPEVLSRILNHRMHEYLHWLSVGPGRFPFYRGVWNRLCDEMGLPDEKIPDPDKPESGQTDDLPF
jgi:hypothetical protein